MSDSQPSPDKAEQAADSGESDSSSRENWFDRLRAMVGIRSPGGFREDLERALTDDTLTEGAFTPEERVMLRNLLRLRDVRVEDVMVPRADIVAVEIDATLGELLLEFREAGHSRMPVYRETLDDPVGFVHIKDLMSHVTKAAQLDQPKAPTADAPPDIQLDLSRVNLFQKLGAAGLVRNLLFVPPSMPAVALLAKMQASHMQIALVIDEYGGTDGLVSLEDIVETVVGEIEDEHDDEEGPMIVPDHDGGFLADARVDLDEVAEALGTRLDVGEKSEDVDTLGGLVFSILGRIPVRGELIAVGNGFELEVLDADPRRVKRLRILRAAARRRSPRPGAA